MINWPGCYLKLWSFDQNFLKPESLLKTFDQFAQKNFRSNDSIEVVKFDLPTPSQKFSELHTVKKRFLRSLVMLRLLCQIDKVSNKVPNVQNNVCRFGISFPYAVCLTLHKSNHIKRLPKFHCCTYIWKQYNLIIPIG